MSGIVGRNQATENMLVIVKVGLKIQGGDASMIRAARERNEEMLKAAEERCKQIAQKAQKELTRIINEHKLQEHITHSSSHSADPTVVMDPSMMYTY